MRKRTATWLMGEPVLSLYSRTTQAVMATSSPGSGLASGVASVGPTSNGEGKLLGGCSVTLSGWWDGRYPGNAGSLVLASQAPCPTSRLRHRWISACLPKRLLIPTPRSSQPREVAQRAPSVMCGESRLSSHYLPALSMALQCDTQGARRTEYGFPRSEASARRGPGAGAGRSAAPDRPARCRPNCVAAAGSWRSAPLSGVHPERPDSPWGIPRRR